MAHAPTVDDGARRIVAHARGAHEVAVGDAAVGVDAPRAGLLERLGRALRLPGDEPRACSRRAGTRSSARGSPTSRPRWARARPGSSPRGGPRTGRPIARCARGVPARDGGAPAPRPPRRRAPARPSSGRPRCRAPTTRRARTRGPDRSVANSRLWIRPPLCACHPWSGSSNRPATVESGCSISRRPTRPDEFARAGRDAAAARGADGVRREQDDAGTLEVLAPVAVDPLRARDQPGRVGHEPADARARHDPAAACDDVWPVGEIRRRLGALVAARHARAALHTRVTALVLGGEDRVRLRPPVPAEPRVCAGDAQARGADRQRGERRVRTRWVHRVAAEARHAELAVDALVVGEQLVVVESASRRRRRRCCGRGSPRGACRGHWAL